MRTVLLIISILAGFPVLMTQEQQANDCNWPCQDAFPILKNDRNEPVTLTIDDTLKQVVQCEPAMWPEIARRAARLEGTVTVEIAVAPDGKVRCLHILSGHIILNSSSMEAAKHWTFRPKEIAGRKVGFLGVLKFVYSMIPSYNATRLPKPECTIAVGK